MTDVHEPEVRRYNMSQIRSKDTKPEMILRKFLFKNGFRYRLYSQTLPGKPDIVLPKFKIVIFVHGCFWHKHEGCKYFVIPKTRPEWWLNKINKNRDRDVINKAKLINLGWKVITIWTCEIKKDGSGRIERLVDEIKESI